MTSTLNALMGRLRIRQLNLLIALDEHRSLHRAAAALSMTQSAASKSLAEVESMIEAPLFERSKSGIVPNQLGQCVIRYARLMRTDLGALCQEIAEIRSGRGGRIAIGAIMGAIPDLIVPTINWLHARQPKLSIELVEGGSDHLLHLLDQGRIDLAIARTTVSPNPSLYNYQPLADEPTSIVVGYTHPPIRAKHMTLKALERYHWVTYPSRMPIRALLDRELDQAGLTMPGNPIETASTFATVSLLLNRNDLVSILPTAVANFFAAHRLLRILPIRFNARIQTFGIVTRRGGTLSPTAAEFIRLLRERELAH